MGFPPYSYVPGGPWPHPKSHPRGHAYHTEAADVPPIDPARWQESEAYLEGFRFFDAGYYWESHEVWEGLWHAAGRQGPVADMLKALIKLAAAGVKIRERRPGGVVTHAERAANILRELNRNVGAEFMGQHLPSLVDFAERTKNNVAILSIESVGEPVLVVFDRKLSPA
jgi:hypothetical protein